jgi:hypothetical protein
VRLDHLLSKENRSSYPCCFKYNYSNIVIFDNKVLSYQLCCVIRFLVKKAKGTRWMPWYREARKDVISCEKPREGANDPRSVDFRMGQPGPGNAGSFLS